MIPGSEILALAIPEPRDHRVIPALVTPGRLGHKGIPASEILELVTQGQPGLRETPESEIPGSATRVPRVRKEIPELAIRGLVIRALPGRRAILGLEIPEALDPKVIPESEIQE